MSIVLAKAKLCQRYTAVEASVQIEALGFITREKLKNLPLAVPLAAWSGGGAPCC